MLSVLITQSTSPSSSAGCGDLSNTRYVIGLQFALSSSLWVNLCESEEYYWNSFPKEHTDTRTGSPLNPSVLLRRFTHLAWLHHPAPSSTLLHGVPLTPALPQHLHPPGPALSSSSWCQPSITSQERRDEDFMSIFPLGSFFSKTLPLDEFYPGRKGFPTKQGERQKKKRGRR